MPEFTAILVFRGMRLGEPRLGRKVAHLVVALAVGFEFVLQAGRLRHPLSRERVQRLCPSPGLDRAAEPRFTPESAGGWQSSPRECAYFSRICRASSKTLSPTLRNRSAWEVTNGSKGAFGFIRFVLFRDASCLWTFETRIWEISARPAPDCELCVPHVRIEAGARANRAGA
jgi:hypothetical protein